MFITEYDNNQLKYYTITLCYSSDLIMARRKEYVTLFGDLRIIHIQTPLLEQFWRQAPTGITVI